MRMPIGGLTSIGRSRIVAGNKSKRDGHQDISVYVPRCDPTHKPVPTPPSTMSSSYQHLYDPTLVTESRDFRVIDADESIPKDVNFGCAYNPAHEIHLVQLPKPEPRENEVLVHIRSTGICGSDCHFWWVSQASLVRKKSWTRLTSHPAAGNMAQLDRRWSSVVKSVLDTKAPAKSSL